MQEGQRFSCVNHQDRPGVGICVVCKRVFCSECLTRIEDINHCKDCLENLAQRPAPKNGARWQTIVAYVFLPLFFLCYSGGWVLLSLSLPAVEYLKIESKVPINISRLEIVRSGILQLYSDTGRLPTNEEGIRALIVSGPDGIEIEEWDGPYISGEYTDEDENPLDAYNRPFKYLKRSGNKALVASMGGDGEWNTDLEGLGAGEKGDGDDMITWIMPTDLIFLEEGD